MNQTPSPSTMDRPFDEEAADELLTRLAQAERRVGPNPETPVFLDVLLQVRFPEDQHRAAALADSQRQVADLALAIDSSLSNPEKCISFVDNANMALHVRANASLVRSLLQEHDYFWHVGLAPTR